MLFSRKITLSRDAALTCPWRAQHTFVMLSPGMTAHCCLTEAFDASKLGWGWYNSIHLLFISLDFSPHRTFCLTRFLSHLTFRLNMVCFTGLFISSDFSSQCGLSHSNQLWNQSCKTLKIKRTHRHMGIALYIERYFSIFITICTKSKYSRQL